MILKKVNLSNVIQRFSAVGRKQLIPNYSQMTSINQSNQLNLSSFYFAQNYHFSTGDGKRPQMSQTKITFEIQKASSIQQLHQIISTHQNQFNFIHRTVLLQKVTQRPFDQDDDLIQNVIEEIKQNWKYDFAEPIETNSRAIASTICYMSRKRKMHELDGQFSAIDFFELAKHLNPKEFVMTLNGLLKLELLDKVQRSNPNFTLQKFIEQNINEDFVPSLLVSMWFNILKFEKSSQKINNFFAQLLKSKHFKNNLVDYMQIIYCYVNSEGKRTVDLTYPVMTHPKQLREKSYIGAHELSVLYEQLGRLKKIKEMYFSDEFSQLLETCFLRILNERDIPLRNVANVFNNLIQYENPTSKTLQATFHKYYTVLKNEITLLQRHQPPRKFRANVDPLSFVTLFNQLLENYQTQNNYLNELTSIALNYVQKIVGYSIISEYNQRTFIRLLYALDLAKKLTQQKSPGKRLQLNSTVKFNLQKEILKRNFNEVGHLGKIISFVYNFDIRSKFICDKIKKLIESIPKDNEIYNNYQQRLKQSCILHKNCKNCAHCFSN